MPDEMVSVTIKTDEQANRIADETEEFLALASKRFRLVEEAESETRHLSLDDLKFSLGDQWPDDIQSSRTADLRPCLTINRIPPIINQVINDERQNRPGIIISPIGDKGDIDTAQMIQGMVRHIERVSEADVAYDTGFESSVRIGFGYWRVITQYSSDDSFDQEIKIVRIKNPFSVFYDPGTEEADYSDADFCFIITDMPLHEYKLDFPDSEVASLDDFVGTGNQFPGWMTKDYVRVAEYYYVEQVPKKLFKLENGQILTEDDYEKLIGEEKPNVIDQRDIITREVKWAKINAIEVLEQEDVPCRWIPVVPVIGNDQEVDGKRHISGLVRNAKDPQRMYNYWKSAATEVIALAPKAPFIAAEGQLENQEEKWQLANVKTMPYLLYKPTTSGGQPVPPPQRNVFEPPVQAINMMIAGSDNDIKATTGIFDAALGAMGPEQSGKAILARQRQSSVSTLNFGSNLSRAIRFTGRIIVDMMPKIYDAPRIVRIINPDQSSSPVAVFNSQVTQMDQQQALQSLNNPNLKRIYDVGVGKYDVAISSGPSYETKRQEAADAIMVLIQHFPNIMSICGDLLVRNMDWPYAQEIADRLKKTLPPNLQELDNSNPQDQIQSLQNQLQTVMQQHDALTQELNKATETIRTKRIETESKERIAMVNAQVQLMIEQGKIQGEAALVTLKAQIDDIQRRLQILHEGEPIESEA